MTRAELECKIRDAVEEYIADEEAYDDNAQLLIDPEGWEVSVVNSEDADGDHYDVMDLIMMSPSAPGKWEVDEDAVLSVAADYIAE